MKRYVLIFLFVVATGFVLKAVWKTGWDMGRQYEGVCLETGKRLTDEEKLRKIVEDVYTRSPIVVSTNNFDDGNRNISNIYEQIPYSDPDEFIKENPRCCSLRTGSYSLGGRSMFLEKSLGLYAGDADITYKAQYLDDRGNKKKVPSTVYRRIDNCGYVDVD